MNTPTLAEPSRIGLKEKVGYGLGDMASNLYFQFFNLFLFYYYTDVFGLNPLLSVRCTSLPISGTR